MGFPVILQIIGYQNSGKTTVITKLLKSLSSEGIRCGVLKHHGHDEPMLHDSGKDTQRHRQAGAIMTGISSSHQSIFSMDVEMPLEKGIQLYKMLNIECVLIEGYKHHQYPRVVMCRNEKDEELITYSETIVSIISDQKLSKEHKAPLFLWSEEREWLPFLINIVKKRQGDMNHHETF
ncbi:molybdopterin-guanine dinucleotide biosynthesis protein B [Fictibacillus nanhaiensis]|uniref:molybdopterin-guanine dinucleotide biosynthesis protein B n=1 Tax=Fictibacillus nanhaiensis TaxID=742169 RepID=UPI001C963CA8|nr:molybdopterin-guanine dinucleotide biosynthesis protein B [Fictibacillus nanhaiensis]MBY6036347.1 molybdopterin-guanine dinucleotide biosynthesis protein B [Fictibacillus nanhaiensis]